MEDRLALELLREVKAYGKRWFIAFIIALSMLFISNLAWLYAWNLPSEESTTTSTEYDVKSEDNGNAVFNNKGKVDINGKSESKKNNN